MANPTRTDPVRLTPSQTLERLGAAYRAEQRGDQVEADRARTEVAIGARVRRGPGDHGYHPTLAALGADLGLKHDTRTNRLAPPRRR